MNFPPMRALEFITGRVTFKLHYDQIYQMKTTLESSDLKLHQGFSNILSKSSLTFSSPRLFVVFFNIKLFKISGSTYFSGYISSKLPIEELIHEKICNILAR